VTLNLEPIRRWATVLIKTVLDAIYPECAKKHKGPTS